ncbi:translocase of chloroplast 101, chloroplastic-like [Phragmites australis]|uniref:translocase of chloroplast 101, chloroplastic-like n=1 Tax=Phragmites australis TaxID=29695 RepID=UPI002D78BD6C|nr:translocase of chloroplast 101, chloroplastic-like [Phragmites australis]
MATTTDAARVAPVEDENPAPAAAAEEPKKVEAAAEEEPKKVVADGGEEEEVRLEGKGGGFGSPVADNGEAEADGGGADSGEVKEVQVDEKGESLGAAVAEKEDGDGEAAAAASVVAETPAPAVESKLENGELAEGDAYSVSPDAPEGEEKGELREEQEAGEQGALAVEADDADKVTDDAKLAVAEDEKPEGEKGEEVGAGGGDVGELGSEKEVDEPEDKVAPAAEANGELGGEVEAVDETVAVGGEEAPEESLEKDADVEDEVAKPEPVNEASPVVIDDGSAEKLAPASVDSGLEGSPEKGQNAEDRSSETFALANSDTVLEGSPAKGQNAEDQVATSEAVEDNGESVVADDTDDILSRELAPESSKENNGDEEAEGGATEVVDREEEAGDDDIVEAAADDEDGVGNEADEDDDGANSDTSPARVAILESSEAAKQIMKELAEGSSGSVSGSRDYTNSMDGQIMLDDSEEDEDDDDNDDGDEKGFDSAALAALLKAATGASSDGNITVASQDGSRIFTMDRPAGLGSSAPSLRPTAPRQPARSNLFSPSELAVTADPTEEMTEEEKKLHDKVELIRVKFLRLVYKLGATPEETVAAQVLYRLSLAEGIRHGRQTNRAFSLDNARKKALLLEAEGKEDLNFSCNILVLGKTGVGKSATINSIFGEEKSKTDAFGAATTSVREIVGEVDGVKIRIIDTPGLRPNVMDQGSNRKILAAVKKYTKKCPPDIVLYVDRLDSLSRDLNDLPLLKTITAVLGSSIWFNAIVALTHAASAPPEGLNGAPMTYEVLMAQRSHIIQQSIRQAAGDMRLMNPVALVENHPSCRKNREGQKVLPNGQSWRHQMLLLCYSSKILSEANSLLKLQDPNPGKLFGFRFRSPPLPFLLSSLLQSRAHPKLSPDQGGNEGDSDIDLDDYSDIEQDDDEEEYDQLPPFKPLTKAQLARLTKEQKNAYFDEYDYRVKLLQKKQWKDELRRLKEMKKRGKTDLDDYGYANIAGENDQDPPPENVSVPLPDMVLPPSFDCDNPTYRYRFLEPTSTVLARPVLDAHGWDHDCGYDGVSVEETLAILNRFPANVAVQVTKDKKEFSIHLDSSIAAKHGENASSLAGFDIQTVGRQLAYILRGETKIKNIKKNKTTGGFSVTFLGDIVATGLKVEDQLSLGKRLALVASTGAMRAQGDTAYGANLEVRLKDKDYPIGQSLSTLGLSLMKWRRDLALGANLQSQFSIGRGSKMALRLGLNNKLSGQITVRTSTSEQVQIALLGLVPVAASIYRSFRPSEPSFAY